MEQHHATRGVLSDSTSCEGTAIVCSSTRCAPSRTHTLRRVHEESQTQTDVLSGVYGVNLLWPCCQKHYKLFCSASSVSEPSTVTTYITQPSRPTCPRTLEPIIHALLAYVHRSSAEFTEQFSYRVLRLGQRWVLFVPCRNSPSGTQAAPLLRFLDRTHKPGSTPLYE